MMEDNIRLALNQARDYIRLGKVAEARPLLVGVLKDDPNNERAWYMLAFVFDQPERRRYALEQVLRINPDNEKARQKLQALTGAQVEAGGVEPSAEQEPTPAPPLASKETSKRRTAHTRRRISTGLLVLIFAAVLAIIVFVTGAILLVTGVITLPPVNSTAQKQAEALPTTSIAPPSQAPIIASPTARTQSPTATTTQWVYQPRFEPANCEFKIPEDISVDCGFVIVPEARTGGSINKVRLAVAVYHSTSEAPSADPVIFLAGGPGSDAIKFASEVYDYYVSPILAERDFIVFDQRGVGLSRPSLVCQELEELYLEYIGQSITETELGPQYVEAFKACRDRLAYMGIDLGAYTTVANAVDVKDILTALNYQQANLYGVSYGTRLALAVMRDYPEVVRSAVLDSPLPLESRLFNQLTFVTNNSLSMLFADCAADLQCSTEFPELEDVFYRLVEQLSAQPVKVDVLHPINGSPYEIEVDSSGLISAISWGLRISPLSPDMPQTIYDIRDGDYAYLGALLSKTTSYYSGISMGMYMSVNCHEQVYATTPEEMAADLVAYPALQAYGYSLVYGSPQTLFEICEAWGAAPYDPGDSRPLVSEVPTLILSGEYDPATPPLYGRQIDANLVNSFYLEFPGQGHSLSTAAITSCPFDIALAFIDEPENQPDTTCVAEMGAPWFVVPFKAGDKISFETFSDGDYGVRGVVPADWQYVGYGYHIRAASVLDPTQVGIQTVRASSDQLLDYLTRNFMDFGFDEAAQFTGTYQGKGLTWNLYLAKAMGNRVDLALAERSGRTVMVLFVSKARERDALYQAAFLPIVISVETLR